LHLGALKLIIMQIDVILFGVVWRHLNHYSITADNARLINKF
jgi:hypothetical protein